MSFITLMSPPAFPLSSFLMRVSKGGVESR